MNTAQTQIRIYLGLLYIVSPLYSPVSKIQTFDRLSFKRIDLKIALLLPCNKQHVMQHTVLRWPFCPSDPVCPSVFRFARACRF